MGGMVPAQPQQQMGVAAMGMYPGVMPYGMMPGMHPQVICSHLKCLASGFSKFAALTDNASSTQLFQNGLARSVDGGTLTAILRNNTLIYLVLMVGRGFLPRKCVYGTRPVSAHPLGAISVSC